MPDAGKTTPAGNAVFGFRSPGNILTSEAAVPVTSTLRNGRIFVEVTGPVNTGIVFLNPNNQPVTINFFFTNSSGTDFGANSTTVGPNSQGAFFLNQAPFNSGTLSASSPLKQKLIQVAHAGLRGAASAASGFRHFTPRRTRDSEHGELFIDARTVAVRAFHL
jgi:hypothetical protein